MNTVLGGVGVALKGSRIMSVGTVVLLAVFSAFWIYGLMEQFHSDDSLKRYLAISLAVVAVGVFRYTRPKKD